MLIAAKFFSFGKYENNLLLLYAIFSLDELPLKRCRENFTIHEV